MLTSLKPYFLELTKREMDIVWEHFCHSRRHHAVENPFRTPEQMFDYLHSEGVYHTELIGPLLPEEKHRPILRKLLGAEV